ncbi:PAS domain S-box protein [Gimesia fumaroli]|nr:PAS domain S-box protein [Gimesia fumaroli]
MGVCLDFTEKQLQENALLESEQNFRSTFEQVAMGIAHVAPDGRWLRVNSGLSEIVGYSSEELLELTYQEITHPDDLETNQKNVELLIAGVIESFSMEKRYLHKKGALIWTKVTVSLIRHSSGEPKHFISVIEDIQRRKEVEASLEMYNKKVKKLSLVASKTKHPVIICDPQGKIEWVNDAFTYLTCYSLNDVVEKHLTEILHGPNTNHETMADLKYHIELKESVATEIAIYDREGYEYWIELKIDPVLGDDGALLNFIATQIDITARKQSEIALRKVNAQFSKLLQADILGIMTCRSDGKIEQANDESLRILGYTAEDFDAGLIDLKALTPPEWLECDQAVQREIKETGAAKPVEKEFFRKDGTRVPVVFGVTQLDEADDLCLCFVLDATTQKQKEAEVAQHSRELQIATEKSKANERRIEAIVNTAVDPIITISGIGNIKSFNPAAERLFGYTASEILEKNIKLLMPSPYREEHDGYLARYLATGKQNVIGSGREAIGQRKNGTTFPLHLAVSQVVVENSGKDKEILFTGIIRDLTEQKQKEAEAAERTRELQIATEKSKSNERRAELANRTKSDFLANMSHELRTPLNGVIGMTELLAGTNLSQRQQEFVDACRNSGESLLKLINDILDFSKIEAGKLELDIHDFDLENLVMDTARTMVWRTAEKKLELPSYVHPESRLVLKGDSYRLRQILVNLLGNAIKFTDTGEIVVRAQSVSRKDDQITIRFSVSDTGIGISKDKLNRLFQSFSQVDASTTRHYGGTGLGLVISQNLVELMGGEIGIESQQGVGSTFWFEIPFTVVSDSRVALPVDSPIAGKRALIVEDNQTKRTIIQAYMTEWNIESIGTASVDEALDAINNANAENRPFDLIVTDFDMPHRNGLDLAEALKDSPEKMVLLLSSTNVEFTDRELMEYGIDTILRKPIQRHKLYEMICSLFANNGDKQFVSLSHNDPVSQTAKKLPTTRILLAEDNNINLMYVTELMQQLGCMCDTACNGLEAVKAVQQRKYDLILMDCQMPELDGFEATRKIRELESEGRLKGHIPIVALTANAIKGDRERCFEAGMDEYLSKPVQKNQIINVLERILSQKETTVIETPLANAEPTNGEESSVPPPIDAALLLERCFGSLDLAGSLLDELESTGRDRVAEIRQQAEASNAQEMALAAHSLKGATGILCASSLLKLSEEIELAGHESELEGIENLIDHITSEMERCLNNLPQLREEMRLLKEGDV